MKTDCFFSKRAIAFASAVALTSLLPVAAVAASTHSKAAASSSSNCTTAELVVWLDTQGSHSLGHNAFSLEFTNLSHQACVLQGYPGVSATNLGGRELGRPASPDSAQARPSVRLAPGGTAISVLTIANADFFSGPGCRAVNAAGLRVYPPNQTKAKVVAYPFRACSHHGTDYLTVTPVKGPTTTSGLL
jgi:Protein of unknown function (DUF4232)